MSVHSAKRAKVEIPYFGWLNLPQPLVKQVIFRLEPLSRTRAHSVCWTWRVVKAELTSQEFSEIYGRTVYLNALLTRKVVAHFIVNLPNKGDSFLGSMHKLDPEVIERDAAAIQRFKPASVTFKEGLPDPQHASKSTTRLTLLSPEGFHEAMLWNAGRYFSELTSLRVARFVTNLFYNPFETLTKLQFLDVDCKGVDGFEEYCFPQFNSKGFCIKDDDRRALVNLTPPSHPLREWTISNARVDFHILQLFMQRMPALEKVTLRSCELDVQMTYSIRPFRPSTSVFSTPFDVGEGEQARKEFIKKIPELTSSWKMTFTGNQPRYDYKELTLDGELVLRRLTVKAS